VHLRISVPHLQKINNGKINICDLRPRYLATRFVEITNDRTAVTVRLARRRGGPARRQTPPCLRFTLVAIHRILDFSAFQPEQIACMRAAYEDAMDVLKHADVRLSELVAKHIIEVARTGERDPDRLREKALAELGILDR